MNKFFEYNMKKYIDSILEVKQMNLDAVLSGYAKCKKYVLNSDVAEYIHYVDEKPFYIPPSISDVKTNNKSSSLNPKFVLFSAPGATGKSSLAKYVANKFDAIYWNLAKVKIGTNSFAGSILTAVGASKYSEFVGDLNSGKMLLVIDAFDEAEIVSGRKMINSFISEISSSMTNHTQATVFLLARTETAQYIASFCAENAIAIAHYEIGFFVEESAKDFIIKSVAGAKTPTGPDIECANSYYDVIKHNITTEERASFLGYAPVLEAISTHIKESPNRQKLLSELAAQKDCVSVIMKIMKDLLYREQTEKVVPAFRERCKDSHPEFNEWDSVYSEEEQLVRLIYYVLFSDTSYDNYPLDFLPPQLVDDYKNVLESFLKQHPFVRTNAEIVSAGRSTDFTGPAFRDYSLASIMLNPNFEELANMYFDESHSQSYFPSQILFDCYMSISEQTIQPNHISYIYDSFKAKATAYESTYLQCSEIPVEEGDSGCLAVFGMLESKHHSARKEDVIANIPAGDSPLVFGQLINVSIDTPTKTVIIGRSGLDARIYNSSIICDTIKWEAKNIIIESYPTEGCLIVSNKGFQGDLISFDIVNNEKLKISAPNINLFYKLVPYSYHFEDATDLDITRFIHALRCILVEFRTHRKDTLAKNAERIDYVTVGNSEIKRQVLGYLKDCGIIYLSAPLYKVDEAKMQEKGIHYNALARMDSDQLAPAFSDFCNWMKEKI